MIRIVSVALLLVVFVGVLSGPASAECAWVLWTETDEKHLKRDDPRARSNQDYPVWTLDRNVHETRAACELALEEKKASVVKVFKDAGAQVALRLPVEHDFMIRLGERMVTVARRDDWFLVYKYACLPDTIDPRGPKSR